MKLMPKKLRSTSLTETISYKLQCTIESEACQKCITSRTCNMRVNKYNDPRTLKFTDCSSVQELMKGKYATLVAEDIAQQKAEKAAATPCQETLPMTPNPAALAAMLNVGLTPSPKEPEEVPYSKCVDPELQKQLDAERDVELKSVDDFVKQETENSCTNPSPSQ